MLTLFISGIIIWPTFCSKVIPFTILFIKSVLFGKTHSLESDQSTSAKIDILNIANNKNFFILYYPKVIYIKVRIETIIKVFRLKALVVEKSIPARSIALS